MAWVDEGQLIVWDRSTPRGPLDRSPRGVYRVPADGVVAFDLDNDGTLIAVRPTIHFADEGSYAVDAFWPADPHPHRVGTAATPQVRVAGGRKAYVAWQYSTRPGEDPLVVAPARGRDYTVAALFFPAATHGVCRLGAFDLDPTRLAWAEQITVSGQTITPPVRLVAVPVSGTPSGGSP